MDYETITLKQLRDFVKRSGGDTIVMLENAGDGAQYEVNDMALVKTKDGMKLVLEFG